MEAKTKKPASKNGGKRAAKRSPTKKSSAASEETLAPEGGMGMGASLQLKAAAAPLTEIQVKELRTGNVVSSGADFTALVRPGEYMLTPRARGDCQQPPSDDQARREEDS